MGLSIKEILLTLLKVKILKSGTTAACSIAIYMFKFLLPLRFKLSKLMFYKTVQPSTEALGSCSSSTADAYFSDLFLLPSCFNVLLCVLHEAAEVISHDPEGNRNPHYSL